MCITLSFFFFFSSRRRHTRLQGDWSSDVCSSDLPEGARRQPVKSNGRRKALSSTGPHSSAAVRAVALAVFLEEHCETADGLAQVGVVRQEDDAEMVGEIGRAHV